MLHVYPVDNSHIKVKTSEDIATELRDFFTFDEPNGVFKRATISKRFGKKISWDGKTRLYSKKTGLLYRGLLPYVKHFAQERGYDIEIHGEFDTTMDIPTNLIETYAKVLKLHSGGKKIEAHDYQIKAVAHALRDRRCVLLSPTASGKSLIIYMMIRWLLLKPGAKGLIIVPSTSLVAQLLGDFKDYSSENGWDADKHVHFVYAGREKTSNKEIILTTWQSIFEQDADFFKPFNFVIADEAHGCTAQSLRTIMGHLVNASFRVGTSGTLQDTQMHKLVLEGLFGPIRKVITTRELMDKGKVSQLQIKAVVLKYTDNILDKYGIFDYDKEIEFLVENPQRNNYIKNLAVSRKRNTLVLFYKREHGQHLYDIIKDEVGSERNVYLIHGLVETDEREQIRKILECEENAILVASYGTFSTGNNVKNLHYIIFAHPYKSKIKNLQSIGRGLRLHESKEKCVLYDIADDLSRGSKEKNSVLEHFVERLKIYNAEKFDFEIYKVSIGE